VNAALMYLDRLASGDIAQLARSVAGAAPELAASVAGRLPTPHRAIWVAAVADSMVRSDPDRAIGFLAAYRGDAGYEEGVVAVVRQVVSVDPLKAAALLETVDTSSQQVQVSARDL